MQTTTALQRAHLLGRRRCFRLPLFETWKSERLFVWTLCERRLFGSSSTSAPRFALMGWVDNGTRRGDDPSPEISLPLGEGAPVGTLGRMRGRVSKSAAPIRRQFPFPNKAISPELAFTKLMAFPSSASFGGTFPLGEGFYVRLPPAGKLAAAGRLMRGHYRMNVPHPSRLRRATPQR